MPAVPGDPEINPAVSVPPLPIALFPGGANGGPRPPDRPDGLPVWIVAEAGGQRFMMQLSPGDNTEADDGREIPWEAIGWYLVLGTPPAARRPLGLPWAPSLPFPDGSIGRGDRRQLAHTYRGALQSWQ